MKLKFLLLIFSIILFNHLASAVYIDNDVQFYSSVSNSTIIFDTNATIDTIEITSTSITLTNLVCFNAHYDSIIYNLGVPRFISYYCHTIGTYTNPIGLKFIGINLFSGNPFIFVFLMFLLISVIGGIFKIPQIAFFVFLVLAGIILYNWFIKDIYIITLVIAGLFIGYAISRMVRK